ncbi:MAG TPA: MarR family transcriptional regulator [Gaiellales bacterium]|nr:MarR family transcriptional regulator [Gaiellales bacterium]
MASRSEPTREDELRRAAAFRAALRGFSSRTEQVAAAAGLTPQRYDLLLTVRAAPDEVSTVTDLSRQLRLRQTAVTELVNRAEEAGLVRRAPSPQDGRVTLIRLSAKGERRLMLAFEGLRDERAQVRRALREVGARFRENATGVVGPD